MGPANPARKQAPRRRSRSTGSAPSSPPKGNSVPKSRSKRSHSVTAPPKPKAVRKTSRSKYDSADHSEVTEDTRSWWQKLWRKKRASSKCDSATRSPSPSPPARRRSSDAVRSPAPTPAKPVTRTGKSAKKSAPKRSQSVSASSKTAAKTKSAAAGGAGNPPRKPDRSAETPPKKAKSDPAPDNSWYLSRVFGGPPSDFRATNVPHPVQSAGKPAGAISVAASVPELVRRGDAVKQWGKDLAARLGVTHGQFVVDDKNYYIYRMTPYQSKTAIEGWDKENNKWIMDWETRYKRGPEVTSGSKRDLPYFLPSGTMSIGAP